MVRIVGTPASASASVGLGTAGSEATAEAPVAAVGGQPAATGRRVEIPAYVDTGLRQFGTFVRDAASTAVGVAGGNKISQIWNK